MSELEDAISILSEAVARLEAAPPPDSVTAPAQLASELPSAPDSRVAEIAAELATRVDAALARLDQILAEEG